MLSCQFFKTGLRRFNSLSYLHNVGDEPLRYQTVGDVLEQSVNTFGDRECLVSVAQNRRYTFREIYQQTNRLSAGLLNLGFVKGDRIGIWCPNIAEWYLTKMACNRTGIILVALNPLNQASEIEYCINKVRMKGIVCPDNIGQQNYYDILNTIDPEIRNSEPGKIRSSKMHSLTTVITISDADLRGTYNYEEVLERADETTINRIRNSQSEISPDHPCDIIFSSGTTGKPKATVQSHFSIVNNSYFAGKRIELDRKQHKICMMVPFFHVFGTIASIMAPLIHGSTLVIPSKTYSPTESLKALKKERCSIIYGTPTMYVDLVQKQSEEKEEISPEIAVWGGATQYPKFIRDIYEVLKVKKGKCVYGLTEATAVVFQSLPELKEQTASVGYLTDHLEAKVVDQNNQIVPRGSPGELCVRGYSMMLGYWEDEDLTKNTLSKDGWLRTGDQVILEEDGFGSVVGRLKDLIIRGGENIFPKEIEDVLNTHPDVIECYVIGLQHDRLGEEVCACIRLTGKVPLTLESIQTFCQGKISKEKIPSQLRIVEEFPKTVSGKIQKFKLVELYKE